MPHTQQGECGTTGQSHTNEHERKIFINADAALDFENEKRYNAHPLIQTVFARRIYCTQSSSCLESYKLKGARETAEKSHKKKHEQQQAINAHAALDFQHRKRSKPQEDRIHTQDQTKHTPVAVEGPANQLIRT